MCSSSSYISDQTHLFTSLGTLACKDLKADSSSLTIVPRHRSAALCCQLTAAATSARRRVASNDWLSAAREAPPRRC